MAPSRAQEQENLRREMVLEFPHFPVQLLIGLDHLFIGLIAKGNFQENDVGGGPLEIQTHQEILIKQHVQCSL